MDEDGVHDNAEKWENKVVSGENEYEYDIYNLTISNYHYAQFDSTSLEEELNTLAKEATQSLINK